MKSWDSEKQNNFTFLYGVNIYHQAVEFDLVFIFSVKMDKIYASLKIEYVSKK
jgi:hypothetical protein